MLALIELSYGSCDLIRKLPQEKWDRLRAEIPQLGLDEWDQKRADEGKEQSWWSSGTKLVDLSTDGCLLAELELAFEVKKFKNTYRHTHVQDGATYNLHVAVPSIGTLLIDEVTWMEDACTEKLQTMLDDGWRILAVCPPNAQRRPDYILGRTRKP